jgi:hypothetical protein
MVIDDGLGPGKVSRLDPDLGSHARNIADAGVQVVAEHLTANALLLERLLPDVGLKRVRGRGAASNLVLICRMHDIPRSHREELFRFDRTADRLPGFEVTPKGIRLSKAQFT